MLHCRYEAVEKSRQEYRENARKQVTENEALQSAVNQVEREKERGGREKREMEHTLQDSDKLKLFISLFPPFLSD